MNTSLQSEMVVLVDDNDVQIGVAPKSQVHTSQTPLHRAFSVFLFNDNNMLLVTRRASTKKTFPGLWTNSVCGHPGPNESREDAAMRRLSDELGITSAKVKKVAPYKYSFVDKNGIKEHEICPIFVGFTSENPIPNIHEVDEWKWMTWEEFYGDMRINPDEYSPWCREEAEILNSLPSFALEK